MNTCKALLFILLAWSTTQLTPQLDNFNSENDPISQVFSGLDFDLQVPDFDLLFNEETANIDSLIDNMQVFLLDTLTNFSEENTEDSFFSIDISTPFKIENRESEISLEDFITPSEETQEVLAFIDELSNKNNNVETLLQENDFFQSLLDNFNEELASLLTVSYLYENAENTEDSIVLPNALSGIAFANVDLNGIEGEEEKGEENLEAKYKLSLNEFNLAGESKSFNIYLAVVCAVIAAVIVGVVAKGVSILRKHETVIEEDTSSNYVEIHDEGSI